MAGIYVNRQGADKGLYLNVHIGADDIRRPGLAVQLDERIAVAMRPFLAEIEIRPYIFDSVSKLAERAGFLKPDQSFAISNYDKAREQGFYEVRSDERMLEGIVLGNVSFNDIVVPKFTKVLGLYFNPYAAESEKLVAKLYEQCAKLDPQEDVYVNRVFDEQRGMYPKGIELACVDSWEMKVEY